LSTEIEKNQEEILKYLVENDERLKDNVYVDAEQLSKATGLTPYQLNDAVDLLHSSGLVDWAKARRARSGRL